MTSLSVDDSANGEAKNGFVSVESGGVRPAHIAMRSGFQWRSRAHLFGLPLLCIAFGCDERGKLRKAKGWIAVGQFAIGVVAIGQFAAGVVGIGQFALGIASIGQLAIAPLVGFGQVAVGAFAVGQVVIGQYARGQTGWASFLWSPERTDMEAVAMFETIEWFFRQDLATQWEALRFSIELGVKQLLAVFY